MQRSAFLVLSFLSVYTFCWPYDESLADYNLNANKTAETPGDYWGEWPDHEYHPSPDNWRLPTYTIFLDRISNGDPLNDDINGTAFEHVLNSNQMRHGGDLEGLIDTLDYIQGMGFKIIYFAGTYLMNLPWAYDGYSPVDTTLLDMHFGTLEDWRRTITEIHNRDMYVMVDNTLSTLSNLVGFKGHLNDSADFRAQEYEVQWVSERQYADFHFSNEYNETCDYPRFWDEQGYPLTTGGVAELKGCYNSDFDQYGELEAFGNFPDWQRQLTKFASVQDRLREWQKPVRDVLTRHSCLQIASLDIDGFRFDKSVQATLEPLSEMIAVYRECAKSYGKDNFFLPGEITSGDGFGSLYLGRGRQPNQRPDSAGAGVNLTNSSDSYFLRDDGLQALDASAFHYTIYRSMTRFLGMDGNLVAGYDLPTDFIEAWNEMLVTNDFLNAFTGELDPRHMFGVSNQDNFRWPAVQNGTDKYLLGLYIVSLELPGMPLILWGEEQAMYVFDATASNYMFGRQPMTYQTAWWTNGCFNLNTSKFYDFPIGKGRDGCNDITITYDQRNPAHPLRNIMKRMFEVREQYPVAQDGLYLQTISQLTEDIYLPGSSTTPTVTGLWSVLRSYFPGVQKEAINGNETLWLVYQNGNATETYGGSCSDKDTALLAPFDSGTELKNLFYPYDELTVADGPDNDYGCVRQMELLPWEYRAYVEASQFVEPGPTVTDFVPGHDARLLSSDDSGESIPIQLGYSNEMDCDSITQAIVLDSKTERGVNASLDTSSVNCTTISAKTTSNNFVGEIPTVWTWSATLNNAYHGVHQLTVKNVSSSGGGYTNSVDKFLLRVGAPENPLIAASSNYSSSLVHKSGDSFYVQHRAAGADQFRYSSDFGRSWSQWETYSGGNTTVDTTGTDGQWKGTHIRVQYFSKLTGSSSYIQEGDYDWEENAARRLPHLWFDGPFNQYGYDAGLDNEVRYDSKTGRWRYDFVYEWPAIGQFNVWGWDKDGAPDTTEVYGDVGNTSVVQKLPPSHLSPNVINMTKLPPFPHLGWTISLNDGNMNYELIPVGSAWAQLALFILLWVVPILMGAAGVFIFIRTFYRVKLNKDGNEVTGGKTPFLFYRQLKEKLGGASDSQVNLSANAISTDMAVAGAAAHRRTVLIATMEYDISDWKVKVKIGGLGVMAQLMSQNLKHQNLIWVVPCVGDIDYPEDTPAEPFEVRILDNIYLVKVQYHVVDNITYILLDAPVFRQQTKAEPYPPRMDDLDSAIYYSAWNQCIAEAIKRTPSIDLYHINDFHGCLAPLYLLPTRTIPVCLSLHNAEFQGLWALRTQQEKKEVCSVFNIPVETATKYCQFGNVFNLLHSGASYLRWHQRGFGAVGVSEKYGKRSWARYPIFWSLDKIGNLPNPDPSDTAALEKNSGAEVAVQSYDESVNDKLQAQKWAGLNEDPNANLLVFVGRWSKQKGVDLIADVMPGILSARPQVQLMCIGPIIDLYGKLAAIKLQRIMEMFPGRVFSRPEFTVLPPFVFSGADFALIPSRDEPFGLIAVEFGRKGALGIGSRIGGLGQMPGWWYTVESDSVRHLMHQLRTAIKSALDSSQETRAEMRANSAKQRFPVLEWVQKLEALQRASIQVHHTRNRQTVAGPLPEAQSDWDMQGLRYSSMLRPMSLQPGPGGLDTPPLTPSVPVQPSLLDLQAAEAQEMQAADSTRSSVLGRKLSLGRRAGPGQGRKRLVKKSQGESQMFDQPVDGDTTGADEDDTGTPEENYISHEEAMAAVNSSLRPSEPRQSRRHFSRNSHGNSSLSTTDSSRFVSRDSSPVSTPELAYDPSFGRLAPHARNVSVLSLPSIVADHDQSVFHLQKVDPTFTDSMGHFTRRFEKLLTNLNKKNSSTDYCIEVYLMKSERKFFDMYNDAQLKKQPKERAASGPGLDHAINMTPYKPVSQAPEESESSSGTDEIDQWLARLGYKRPMVIQRFMRWRVGNWPVYALFLGLGQIIATNSAQITLLVGQVGESAVKLYVIAAIYCVSSIAWWFLFYRFPSVIVLTVPWFIYSLAFIIIGVSPFGLSDLGRGWAQNVAAGVYSAASSSGALFFALNFGDQGAVPVKDWVFRASLIQGLSQLYTVALWFWSSRVTAVQVGGVSTAALSSWRLTAVVMPLAFVCFIIGVLLALGLPKYYRQAPGRILFFYTSLFRRRIVLWFFFMVIIQNWFLAAAVGRNWSFLWSSQHAKTWQVAVLVVVFFVVLWIAVMLLFRFLAKEHSWILPVFGLSVGAPRWAQTWWGTSNIGYYLPWAGGLTSGAIASRCLWLWLGLLDEIQQVGLGMILLQTLTRVHVCFVLLAAQSLGSIATICARGFAPNNVGPAGISPAVGTSVDKVGNAWFWIALFFQLLASFGFLLFYRREQLNRP
ncbi:hypothetical protein BDW59DRAFT_158254 [Aspergillus cavernicola]|uniref:alpha-1,3-glucan synthase n=1 Tax=Aspergillus cavernicola TaxID=176166 RepID=A0ABR4ISS5_9EURO